MTRRNMTHDATQHDTITHSAKCRCDVNQYVSPGAGYLDDVSLVTARRGPGVPARWVEQCTCPQGYQGQHCEQCTLGYRRALPELGAFSSCEPCNCNGHSEACHPDTGLTGSTVLIGSSGFSTGSTGSTGLTGSTVLIGLTV